MEFSGLLEPEREGLGNPAPESGPGEGFGEGVALWLKLAVLRQRDLVDPLFQLDQGGSVESSNAVGERGDERVEFVVRDGAVHVAVEFCLRACEVFGSDEDFERPVASDEASQT